MKNIIILVVLFGALSVHAQKSNFVISYPVSFPVGDLNKFIGKTSFRGVSMEYTLSVRKNVEVGIESAWNLFYEREADQVYNKETVSISGVQYRYTNAVPILAGGKFYPTVSSKKAKPYVGAGLGTLFVNRYTDFGLYRIRTDTWQFCLRPELGVRYELDYGNALIIGAKYFAGFNTDALDGQSYISLNLGYSF